MKLVLKIFGALILLVVLLVGGWIGYVQLTWEKDFSAIEKPAIKASQDPAVIKRGEYLAHSVAHCSICHAPESVTEKREVGEHPAMAGGYEWKMGPLGTLYSRNITPDPDTGIGNWTDEELARAIRWSVDRQGKQLPFMAMGVGPMADEDIQAIISYLRTTAPVKQQNKPHEPGIILKWLATKLGPDFRKPFQANVKYVAPADEPSIERGQYLARGPAACFGCHSPFDMMTMQLSGPEFSGSSQPEPDPKDPNMVFRIPNLTPDKDTGHMATWDEEHFVARFKSGRAIRSSKMPWEAYREMSEADLRSIFRFLRSVPPARHYIGPSWRKASEDPAADVPVQKASL